MTGWEAKSDTAVFIPAKDRDQVIDVTEPTTPQLVWPFPVSGSLVYNDATGWELVTIEGNQIKVGGTD